MEGDGGGRGGSAFPWWEGREVRDERRKVTVDVYGLLTPSRFYKDIS